MPIQLLSDIDGIGSGAAEPIHGIDDNGRYFLPAALYKREHGIELLALICFGTFISAAKVSENLIALFNSEVLTGLALGLKTHVIVGLLLGGYSGIDNTVSPATFYGSLSFGEAGKGPIRGSGVLFGCMSGKGSRHRGEKEEEVF